MSLPFHQRSQTTPHNFGVNVAANSFLGRLSLSQKRVRDSRWRRGVRSDWRPMWARLHGWRRRTNDEELDEELDEKLGVASWDPVTDRRLSPRRQEESLA